MTTIDNPFETLLSQITSPEELRAAYSDQRDKRSTSQRHILLSKALRSIPGDEVLRRIEKSPTFVDQRLGIVFAYRPPEHVKDIIATLQAQLEAVAGDALWLAPRELLHLTTLEVTHSKTVEELEPILDQVKPIAEDLCSYVQTHKVSFDAPKVGIDATALAISFLPLATPYSFHHLRRDLFEMATQAGIELDPRYINPTAHITIARFRKSLEGDEAREVVERLVALVDKLNEALAQQNGSWTLGEANLDARYASVWYGGGQFLVDGWQDA